MGTGKQLLLLPARLLSLSGICWLKTESMMMEFIKRTATKTRFCKIPPIVMKEEMLQIIKETTVVIKKPDPGVIWQFPPQFGRFSCKKRVRSFTRVCDEMIASNKNTQCIQLSKKWIQSKGIPPPYSPKGAPPPPDGRWGYGHVPLQWRSAPPSGAVPDGQNKMALRRKTWLKSWWFFPHGRLP